MPEYPFFTGIVEGAIGRPPQLYYGARRTAASLGLFGEPLRSTVAFHDHVTYQAARTGLSYAIGHHPDPEQLAQMWNTLPADARANVTNFAWSTAGQVTGGSAVSMAASRALIQGLRMPRQVVIPAMFILNAQGAMAALWNDA